MKCSSPSSAPVALGLLTILDMQQIEIVNIIAISIFALAISTYHLYLYHVFRRNPDRLVYGLTSSSRRVFIAQIMNRKNQILAVQTLRNFIMMSQAMATTAIYIILGLMAFLGLVSTKQVDVNNAPISLSLLYDPWFSGKVCAVK
jgi:uncharacterized membrane protein